jgi:phage terminase large subunit GpA-like protein
VTSLGEKIISIGKKIDALEKRGYSDQKMLKVQCSHCGKWFSLTSKNIRVMNYCSECL